MRSSLVSLPIAIAALGAAMALASPAAAHDTGVQVGFDRMAYFDTDQDGRVSKEEFWRSAPEFSGPVFIYADLNNDGFLNRRELARAERRVRQNESRGRRWKR